MNLVLKGILRLIINFFVTGVVFLLKGFALAFVVIGAILLLGFLMFGPFVLSIDYGFSWWLTAPLWGVLCIIIGAWQHYDW